MLMFVESVHLFFPCYEATVTEFLMVELEICRVFPNEFVYLLCKSTLRKEIEVNSTSLSNYCLLSGKFVKMFATSDCPPTSCVQKRKTLHYWLLYCLPPAFSNNYLLFYILENMIWT